MCENITPSICTGIRTNGPGLAGHNSTIKPHGSPASHFKIGLHGKSSPLAVTLYMDVRPKPQDPGVAFTLRRKVSGMLAGKPCRPSFPQPGSPPPSGHLRQQEGSKEKVYNPISEGLGES